MRIFRKGDFRGVVNDTSDLYNDRKSGPKTFLTLMNPKPQTFNPAAQNLYVRSPLVRAGVCASEVEAKQTRSGVYIYRSGTDLSYKASRLCGASGRVVGLRPRAAHQTQRTNCGNLLRMFLKTGIPDTV